MGCAAGTVVRAFVCEDTARCLNEPPVPGARRLLGSATTDQNGAFELGECGAFETASGGVFVFEAEVGEGVVYRTAIAGPAGTGVIRRAAAVGGGADDALQDIVIGPTSEAAVRLLAPVIGNFDLQGISQVVATVDAANMNTSFAGLDVMAAAEVATGTASSDPNVQDTIQSNVLSFSSIITGQFFATPDSQTFAATPSSPAAFQQDFPIINFNPPAGTVSCSNFTGVDAYTRPFTDVVPQPDGSCAVEIGQGNGMQAGCGSPVCDQPSGSLFSFSAVFTGSLTVGKPGPVAFSLYSDDGWILGFGQGPDGAQPRFVSGPLIGAPSASPFSGFQVVGADDLAHGTTFDLLVVNFPAAGKYPFELDYNESYGGSLTLTLTASYASAPSQIVLQGESDGGCDVPIVCQAGEEIDGQCYGVGKCRGNALGGRTVFLTSGQARRRTFQLPVGARYGVSVRYSNDGPNPSDTVTVMVDSTPLEQFVTQDTRPAGGVPGSGWNVFQSSGSLGSRDLAAGPHVVTLRVATSDAYGVEIDAVILDRED